MGKQGSQAIYHTIPGTLLVKQTVAANHHLVSLSALSWACLLTYNFPMQGLNLGQTNTRVQYGVRCETCPFGLVFQFRNMPKPCDCRGLKA